MSATLLYQRHLDLGATMTNFFGWQMPLRYKAQILEHNAVRSDCGIFDVSHMLAIDIVGDDARELLRLIHCNDVDKSIDSGTAIYGCMLNESGGVIDDLICYVIDERHYRLVINASRREQDLSWIHSQAQSRRFHKITITPLIEDTGILALQGPKALEILAKTCPHLANANSLGKMQARFFGDIFVARSGYSGEDGVEIIAGIEDSLKCWDALIDAGTVPCGLGARDSLRLEAGLRLYGHELSESITPLEAGLGWCVDWSDPDRQFVGKEALERQKNQGRKRKLVGLILEEKGMMRAEQKIQNDQNQPVGIITSGGFSPMLNKSIALALINCQHTESSCRVNSRGRLLAASISPTKFI